MKILHVCSNYFPAHGGPQYTLKHLSENLVNWYDDEVQVATSDALYGPDLDTFQKIVPSHENINGVKVGRFPMHNWHYPLLDLGHRISKKCFGMPLPHYLHKYRAELHCGGILKQMKHTEADVIMGTTSQYMFCDYPAWRFKTKHPKPFVLYGAMHLHINWPANSPLLNRAKICDAYIANTDFEKQWLAERGVDEHKIETIGTGINVAAYQCAPEDVSTFRKKHHIQDTDILIGHIGRLSEGKGVGILLQAFNLLHHLNKNVKLLLAGTSTGYVTHIKQQIQALSLPVILLPDFEDAMKPLLFNALDIFVLGSRGESFGVVFLEAWACKKPVIGVRTGAIASVIDEHTNGLFFEHQQAKELAASIQLLAGNPVMRHSLGANGYQKVQQSYTWTVVTEKYRNTYQKAIQNFCRLKQMQQT